MDMLIKRNQGYKEDKVEERVDKSIIILESNGRGPDENK